MRVENDGPFGCEHGCETPVRPNQRFCSQECIDCEHGGPACSEECRVQQIANEEIET